MIDLGRKNVLGVWVNALDYDAAIRAIVAAAKARKPFTVSALAVHGVMTGVLDKTHRYRLNHLDVVTPDGQPVRWALNLLHHTELKERVYGPTLTFKLCEAAADEGLPVYFYGSRPEVLRELDRRLTDRIPKLQIAGVEASKFRKLSSDEAEQLSARVRSSGAKLTFVGLGCPRQEIFVFEFADLIGMPLIATGAAFDYHAGLRTEPPDWVQRHGLQWLYRLIQEPTRLWRRYLLLNPLYLFLVGLQKSRLWKPDPDNLRPPEFRELCA